MRTQHELPRGGLFSKASCSVAMTGSISMTVVFALKASVALWPYADSLASLISRELGSDVIGLGFIGAVGGFLGGLVGVLVGVGVGAVVGAVVHTEVHNLGPQEARVLTVAGLLLSSISVFMFLVIIHLFVFDM